MDALDEPLRSRELRDLFVTSFDHQWCQRGPYELEHWRKLTLSWDHFSRLVRTKHRYLFLRRGDNDDEHELVPPAEMLDTVAQAIYNAPDRMLCVEPAGMSVVRARAHKPDVVVERAADLGSPPSRLAKPNRMSPVGIPMFYAADSPAAVRAEVRPSEGEIVTWGRWETTHDLWCLDLTRARPIPSIFDSTGSINRTWLRFLGMFSDDVSRPTGDSPDIDYVPTQVFTEYVRDVLRSPASEQIMAIKYASAALEGAICWVFFVGPEECGDLDTPRTTDILLLDRASLQSTSN